MQILLADSKLPPSFWGWAVSTIQYLRNRLPTSVLPTGVTPFEALKKQKPDLYDSCEYLFCLLVEFLNTVAPIWHLYDTHNTLQRTHSHSDLATSQRRAVSGHVICPGADLIS